MGHAPRSPSGTHGWVKHQWGHSSTSVAAHMGYQTELMLPWTMRSHCTVAKNRCLQDRTWMELEVTASLRATFVNESFILRLHLINIYQMFYSPTLFPAHCFVGRGRKGDLKLFFSNPPTFLDRVLLALYFSKDPIKIFLRKQMCTVIWILPQWLPCIGCYTKSDIPCTAFSLVLFYPYLTNIPAVFFWLMKKTISSIMYV